MYKVTGIWILASAAALASLCGPAFAQTTASPGWDSVVAAAEKEGRVVLYTVAPTPVDQRIKADFEKAYPRITVEYSRLTGLDVIIKVDQERSANALEADVAITAELPWVQQRAKEDIFEVPAGPSAKNWPSAYLTEGVAPVVSLEPFVMAYNADLVKAPLVGYQDLLKPEFQGRVGVIEPNSVATVSWYDWLERTQGGDFLAKLASQKPRIYPGGAVPSTQGAAAGEIVVTSFTIMSIVLPLADTGAPLKAVIPNPSIGTRFFALLLKGSKRPNAAAVFVDYLMSSRGQAIWNNQAASASPLSGTPKSVDPSTIGSVDLRPFTPTFVNAYAAHWKTMFLPH